MWPTSSTAWFRRIGFRIYQRPLFMSPPPDLLPGDGSTILKLDPELLTQGPPKDVIVFLSLEDRGPEAGGLAGGGPDGGGSGGGSGEAQAPDSEGRRQGPSRTTTLRPTGSGVSELWTVDYRELDVQKQIGEGSFGKVHLAKWRETTVAVKVLAPLAGGVQGSGLDEEFPQQEGHVSAGARHPFYDELQKEAAMMASLRHPSIVM